MLRRKKLCIQCGIEFEASQVKAKLCSDPCRSAARMSKQKERRHKTAECRIQRLPVSEEWLWIAGECKRAGTVEILKGHTPETLEQLFALRNYRYKCYGWNAERRTSKYHLCHIQPANGADSVGLLHPHNLFVGSSLPNQMFGTNCYAGVGLSIRKSSLMTKWLVLKEDSDRSVLKKIERYLGKTLKEYAKTNPISTSQRISLARLINKSFPDCQYTLDQLERKGMQELRQLRAELEGKELYQIKLQARRSLVVYLDECQRLSVQLSDSRHKEDLAFMVPVLRTACAWLATNPAGDKQEGFESVLLVPFHVHWSLIEVREGMEASKFRDFISFQAFQALQGAKVDRKMVLATVTAYLSVKSLTPDWTNVPDWLSTSGGYEYFKRDHETFRKQVPMVQEAILTIGIADSLLVHEYLESVKLADAELEWFESKEWAKGASERDYSGMFYEVEEDYVPNPPLYGLARVNFDALSKAQ